MTQIAVVTDSSSLLPTDLARAARIEVVPVVIVIDGEERAEPDVDPDAFYRRLRMGAIATTSLPSPGRLADAYRTCADAGAAAILSVHLDARVSGTAAAARLAAEEAPIPVTVVDVPVVSFGLGICCLEVARRARAGARLEAMLAELEVLASRIGNRFVAPSAPGGRVSAGAGWSVLTFVDGSTRRVAACSDLDGAVRAMAADVAGQGSVRVAAGHADRAYVDAADRLAARVRGLANVTEVHRYRVGPSVGAHTGPDSLGLFWWPAQELS